MNATLNLIEVGNTTYNGTEPLDYTYATLVLLMERGHFIEVSTTYDKDSKKWWSKYTWVWLKTHGLGHKWIPGDPVMTNGNPWVRKNPDLYTMDNATLQVQAHRDAVASLLVLNQSNLYEPAMYMGKPIPNLFTFDVKSDFLHDPILLQEDAIRQRRIAELKAKHPKPQPHPLDSINDLLKVVKTASGEMEHHYIPQSDNYALGA